MEVDCSLSPYHPVSWTIRIYKNRESEVGPFINDVNVFLTWERVSGEMRAAVDLRWDFYYYPTIYIRDLSEDARGDKF